MPSETRPAPKPERCSPEGCEYCDAELARLADEDREAQLRYEESMGYDW